MSTEHVYSHHVGLEPSADSAFPSRPRAGQAPRVARARRPHETASPHQLSLAWPGAAPSPEPSRLTSDDPLGPAPLPGPDAEPAFPGLALTPREWAVLAESVEEYLRVFTEANGTWWADDDDRPQLLQALLEKLPVVS